MSTAELEAVFGVDDLDDGNYHWELTEWGSMYINVAKNVSPELREAILFTFETTLGSTEWVYNIFGVGPPE